MRRTRGGGEYITNEEYNDLSDADKLTYKFISVWVKKTNEEIKQDKNNALDLEKHKTQIEELRSGRIENYKKQIDNADYGKVEVSEEDYAYLPVDYQRKLTQTVSGSQYDQTKIYVFNNPNPAKVITKKDPYTITEDEYTQLAENNKLAYKQNWDYNTSTLYMLKVSIPDDDYNQLSNEYKAKFGEKTTNAPPAEYGHQRKYIGS